MLEKSFPAAILALLVLAGTAANVMAAETAAPPAAREPNALGDEDLGFDIDEADDTRSLKDAEKKATEPKTPSPEATPVPLSPPASLPPPSPSISGAAPEAGKPSAEQGEPIFDWSKHKNETVVPHPFAEKGLIRIDRNQVYYYKVDEVETHHSMSLHIGEMAPSNLRNPDDSGPYSSFASNYPSVSNPAFILMYEWQLWKTSLGKIGLEVGSGAFLAQGHGHFVGPINAGKTPLEVFNFFAMENSFGVNYHFQFWGRQFLVPYAGGGLMPLLFGEFRDDNIAPKFGVAAAGYAMGGVQINMTYFDYMSRVELNREYGISGCYLDLEYRQVLALETRFNFTSPYINAGFMMEF